MCGLFGYFATEEGKTVDLDFLKECGTRAATRGGQAHGLAQVYKGEVKGWRSPGDLEDNLDCIDWVAGATAVIGHTRYSTSGPASINNNNQPLMVSWDKTKYAFVHNGTLSATAWRELKKENKCKTDCDSELIARYAPCTGFTADNLGSALRASITQLEQHGRQYRACNPSYAMLALLPKRLYMVREGNPLYLMHRPEGTYLCSIDVENGKPLDVERAWYFDTIPDTRTSLPGDPKQYKPKPKTAPSHTAWYVKSSEITGDPKEKNLMEVKEAMDPVEWAVYNGLIATPPTDLHGTRRDLAELAVVIAEFMRWEEPV